MSRSNKNDVNASPADAACVPGSGCCGAEPRRAGGLPRRAFLRTLGLAAAATGLPSRHVMAGPFTRQDFDRLVPVDKKLSADWVKSLFARGTPQVFRSGELQWIGQPVGGLCAGQVYLGGDGRLWHWDIFNKHTMTAGEHYPRPLKPASPLQQEFTLTLGDKSRTLDANGFTDISFRGEYPIGVVEFRAADVAVTLEAFSPFIPLNTDDSSLPATIMRFTVKNTGAAAVDVTLTGSMENVVARQAIGVRRNRVVAGDGFSFLECGAANPDGAAQGEVALEGGKKAKLEDLADFGTMGLALLGSPAEVADAEKAVGLLGRKLALAAGEAKTVTFVITWHFPNLRMSRLPGGRYYATKFDSALAVARYVVTNFERLSAQTRLWRDTWYDSTLPYWFLDRTMLNTSILATSTSYRFKDGRFYGWEGVGCCAGTCGHVWHYAHAPARLFPELERDLRERVDFGLALQADGAIWFRGEHNNIPAIDAQAGSVLRAYREHQMSQDSAFLKRVWPGVKRATEWLIAKDANGDGIIESNQHNTLDADWFGPVAWLSGLYLAALHAAEAMALELGDTEFAKRCRAIHEPGIGKLVADLFDGEYFINKPQPEHADAINSGTGCEIDQVMGQSWAWQVGLPRVFPAKETKSALQSLWKYNFTPDVGPYREANKPGRWYAMPGEAGLLMCTFPRTDWDFAKAAGKGHPTLIGYFNECMNGFEYQVAGHMIWEGMVMEGMAITRAVHDRYHASRRNPWNEIECGDHYARSMASYGVFLAACGFTYHGPDARLGFAPKITPEDFKAPFTTAAGWGTFSQSIREKQMEARVQLRWGKLRLRSLALEMPENRQAGPVAVTLNGKEIPSTPSLAGRSLVIKLESDITIDAGGDLKVVVA